MGKFSYLASVSETRKTLERHGLATKHSLGQNFLINDAIIKKIIDLAEVSEDDLVLEVGPGIGTLSVALLHYAESLISIERDPDLPQVLQETLQPYAERFVLLEGDALLVGEEHIRSAAQALNSAHSFPNKLVANLPYAVAATLVLDYFERFEDIQSMTVMVQKEVADRMCALPGCKDYGAFSVKLQMYATAAGRFQVSPQNFFPPPRVDSTVLRLNRTTPHAQDGNPASKELVQAACLMADAAFATRRKTISNSFKNYFSGRGEAGARVLDALPAMLEACGIDARARGESLLQSDFLRLGSLYLERCVS